jgi:hypothetical protein
MIARTCLIPQPSIGESSYPCHSVSLDRSVLNGESSHVAVLILAVDFGIFTSMPLGFSELFRK